jgi:formylglycine-generating enzyme required for sulfatase activity
VFELLGGTPRDSGSVATLTKDSNRMLRRCRTPGEFLDGASLLAALREELLREPAVPHPADAPGSSAAGRSVTPAKPVVRHVPAGRSRAPGSTRGSSSRAGSSARPHASRERLYWAGGAAVFGLLVVVALWSLPGESKPSAAVNPAVVARVPAGAPAPRLNPPEIGKPWVNSLKMEFTPIGKAHMAVFKTRVREFAEFVRAKNYEAEGGVYSWQRDGLKLHDHSWRNPGFPQTPDDPVVAVSWEDANQFCEWLTQKERSEGTLSALQFYRLPTDREWDAGVGLADDPAPWPEARSGKVTGVYPWGSSFPPPLAAGNYAGAESRVNVPENWAVIPGYRDDFPRTRPGSAISPNERGFCDLGGNAWEWCDDLYNERMRWRVLRGGSWATSRKEEMLSSFRQKSDPNFRHDDVGFRCVVGTDRGKR